MKRPKKRERGAENGDANGHGEILRSKFFMIRLVSFEGLNAGRV
jgi:hypothetical protein